MENVVLYEIVEHPNPKQSLQRLKSETQKGGKKSLCQVFVIWLIDNKNEYIIVIG